MRVSEPAQTIWARRIAKTPSKWRPQQNRGTDEGTLYSYLNLPQPCCCKRTSTLSPGQTSNSGGQKSSQATHFPGRPWTSAILAVAAEKIRGATASRGWWRFVKWNCAHWSLLLCDTAGFSTNQHPMIKRNAFWQSSTQRIWLNNLWLIVISKKKKKNKSELGLMGMCLVFRYSAWDISLQTTNVNFMVAFDTARPAKLLFAPVDLNPAAYSHCVAFSWSACTRRFALLAFVIYSWLIYLSSAVLYVSSSHPPRGWTSPFLRSLLHQGEWIRPFMWELPYPSVTVTQPPSLCLWKDHGRCVNW